MFHWTESLERKRVIINIIEKEPRERRMERIRNPILSGAVSLQIRKSLNGVILRVMAIREREVKVLLTKEMRMGIKLILVNHHQGSTVFNILMRNRFWSITHFLNF